MSSATPPPEDELKASTPPPEDASRTEEAGDRSSVTLSEPGDLASSASSLSISAGSVWPLPEDFDIKQFETSESVAKVVKIQAFIRQMSVQRHYDLIVKLHRKRTRVAKEIWNSETTYLEGLMAMYQFFYLPLQKIAKDPNGFITEAQVKLLFGNLEELMTQAKKMNTLLAKVVTTYTPQSKLGPIFTDNAEQLKAAFTPYVDPFDEANALFLSMRKDNERFKEWLAGIEFKQVDLGLESYLIMPIQRVTRYGLLLRELIHQTWQDHDDFQTLNQALKAVEEVAAHVNGHKKMVIMQNKIKSIFASIAGLPEVAVNEERLYITEGALTDMSSIVPVTHHVFLFNDLMVWTQMVNKKRFMFRKLNWLKDSTAEVAESEKGNSFRVVTHDWTTTVFTKTKEDQNKWITYLENENFSPNAQAPVVKRPEAVFFSKKRTVEEALKRGLNRRNAGASIRVKDGSKRGSTRAKKDGAAAAGEGSPKTGKKKDSTRTKIPRGYATMDPKMLEEVKNAAKKTADSRDGKDSLKESKESPDSMKEKKPRDPARALTRTAKSKPQNTITPELLEALRATRDMTEAEQVVYLEKLQKEGHSSLPPVLPGSASSASNSESLAPSTEENKTRRASTVTASTFSMGTAPPMPDVSAARNRGSIQVSLAPSSQPNSSPARTRAVSTGAPASVEVKRTGSGSITSSSPAPAEPSASPSASDDSVSSNPSSSTENAKAPRPTRAPPTAIRLNETVQEGAKRRSGTISVMPSAM